jgi:hypothetical protein
MARRRRRSDTVVCGPSVGTAIHNHACCSWGIYLDKEAAKGGMGSERGSNKRSLESLALVAATIHSCDQQTMQSCVTLDCGVVSCQTARAKLDPGSTWTRSSCSIKRQASQETTIDPNQLFPHTSTFHPRSQPLSRQTSTLLMSWTAYLTPKKSSTSKSQSPLIPR